MAKHPQVGLAAFVLGVGLFAVTGASLAHEKGYLVAFGPPPLRFQPPQRIAATPLHLPPLVAPVEHKESLAPEATNQPVELPPAVSTNQPPAALSEPESPAEPAPHADLMDNSDTNSVFLIPLPPAENVEPEQPGMTDTKSVINYLAPVSTNAPQNRIELPAFVPPTPPVEAPWSSHATYDRR